MKVVTDDADVDAREWQAFVIAFGWRVPPHHLAAVLGVSERNIAKVRPAATRRPAPMAFAELFQQWHGRPPTDTDWPAPRRRASGSYEWLANEDALLATLVGQLGIVDITEALTVRLRRVTNDVDALRSPQSCQLRINRLGLQSSDVVGGVTVASAARQIGSREVVYDAIRAGQLRVRKVGRLALIPHDQWRAWSALRKPAPHGKVLLSTLREPLGIRSDSKLPEFAKLGYIPSAEMHCPMATVQRGVWYIDATVAAKLIEDRRQGLPMPWHGKVFEGNLLQTYKLWVQRRHPAACATCSHIWGPAGAPETIEDYRRRYPALDHGAKRHLTRVWTPGLTPTEVAAKADQPVERVTAAIANGVLQAGTVDGILRVTLTDATRWMARRCPSGESERSWLSLPFAEQLYGFTQAELHGLIIDGTSRSKLGTDGPMRGMTYVLKQQCADLRARLGYSQDEAARRAGVPLERMQQLLEGVQWRPGDRVPLSTLQATIKRLQSRHGFTVEQAAARIGRTEQWVREHIAEGLIRVHTTRWNPDRLYLSAPMLRRLEKAAADGDEPGQKLGPKWLNLSAAALLAGVTVSTLRKWVAKGELPTQNTSSGPVAHPDAVKQRASRYWQTVRFKRAEAPNWYRGTEARPAVPSRSAPGG